MAAVFITFPNWQYASVHQQQNILRIRHVHKVACYIAIKMNKLQLHILHKYNDERKKPTRESIYPIILFMQNSKSGNTALFLDLGAGYRDVFAVKIH